MRCQCGQLVWGRELGVRCDERLGPARIRLAEGGRN